MREGKPPVILPRCVTRRSESSCFALHVNGHWRIGQPRAATLGIAVTGTLGIVAVARRRGLIPAARPYLAHLAKHGFYFSQDLARELLRSVGEA